MSLSQSQSSHYLAMPKELTTASSSSTKQPSKACQKAHHIAD